MKINVVQYLHHGEVEGLRVEKQEQRNMRKDRKADRQREISRLSRQSFAYAR